jgi:lipopolysaccharide transport system permease protein/teichoic acid transport system permease protein
MALREIKLRYSGTLSGVMWSVVNPLCSVLIYWAIFSGLLRAGGVKSPMGDVPFVLYYLSGFIPWSLMQETIMSSGGSVIGNAHLVKKVVFPTELLPVVHLVAGLISHGIMLLILWAVMAFLGFYPSWMNITALYYLFGLSALTLGISWTLASVTVFFRDTAQIAGIFVNIWFWLTPIVWPVDIAPEPLRFWAQFNPAAWVVNGYREAFFNYTAPSACWIHSVWFWFLAVFFFALGNYLFQRLKPEFPDML